MDTENVQSLVEDLGSNIDDLEEALAPILKTALSASTSKLPLLDKAKLYVLATYAIESVLFSALRLNGVDAKAHPVFQELSRVKEYFGKIKTAETAGTKRSTTVDKDAAERFIKHGLAGNEKYDRERADRVAREKAGAKRKLEDLEGIGTHTRFDGAAKRIRAAEEAESVDVEAEDRDPEPIAAEPISAEQQKLARQEAKRQRRLNRLAERGAAELGGAEGADDGSAEATDASVAKSRSNAPKSHSETLQALLQGPLPKAEEKKGKKKKRKSKGQIKQELEDQRADEMH